MICVGEQLGFSCCFPKVWRLKVRVALPLKQNVGNCRQNAALIRLCGLRLCLHLHQGLKRGFLFSKFGFKHQSLPPLSWHTSFCARYLSFFAFQQMKERTWWKKWKQTCKCSCGHAANRFLEKDLKKMKGGGRKKKNPIFHPAQKKALKTCTETNTFSCRRSTFHGNLPPFEAEGAENNPSGSWNVNFIIRSLLEMDHGLTHQCHCRRRPPLGAQRPLEDVCATDRRRLEIISSVFNALRGNILCDFFFFL